MKKKYMKPETEVSTLMSETSILVGSYWNVASGKESLFDEEEEEDSPNQGVTPFYQKHTR